MQVHIDCFRKVIKAEQKTVDGEQYHQKWEVVCGRMINISTVGDFHHKETMLMEEANQCVVNNIF